MENRNIKTYKKGLFFRQPIHNRLTHLNKFIISSEMGTPKSFKNRSVFDNTACVNKKIINLTE